MQLTFQQLLDKYYTAPKEERRFIIGDWLDELYAAIYNRQKGLKTYFSEEPVLDKYELEPHEPYLWAALVEFIAKGQVEQLRPLPNDVIDVPSWIYKDRWRNNDTPWFFMKNKTGEIQILLMIESPLPFKKRNLFVGRNAYTRV